MSIHTQGKLIKTKKTTSDELGRYINAYYAEENKRIFKTCQEYYWYMMEEYERSSRPDDHRHVTLPKQQEGSSVPVIFDDNDRHNLESMCPGASFAVCDDTVHVDNWAVSEEVLFHKHPEFGVCPGFMSLHDSTELEFSVKDGKCDLCHTQIPGTLLFIHQMYQL